MPYTKLDASLIHSTVWREPHPTRIVWITMLAMKDRNGEVMASIPGLADAARVTLPDCETALATFLAPDKYSRNQDHEGRRIEAILGGWLVLNHEQYRNLDDEVDRREKSAERVRRFRERQRNADGNAKALQSVTVTPGNARKRGKLHTEADAEANTETTTTATTSASPTTPKPAKNWLARYIALWEATYGKGTAKAVAGQLARYLKPLHAKHGGRRVFEQLQRYLAEIPARYANPASFAQKFEAWTGKREKGNSTITDGRAALKRFVQEGKDGNS